MRIEPEISDCSIVLIGRFNPAIFHPAWLKAKDIQPEANENTVNLQIVHNDIASFTIDTVSYFVEESRFKIETTSGPWIRIADTTRKIFGDHLVHTPVTAFGINRTIHFRLGSHQARHNLGRKLAPLEPWGCFGEQLEAEDRQLVGGMTKLVMTRKSFVCQTRVDTNVTIEPSARVAANDDGIYMQLNSHHAIEGLPDGHGCETALELIGGRFQEITNEADQIFNWIMNKGSE